LARFPYRSDFTVCARDVQWRIQVAVSVCTVPCIRAVQPIGHVSHTHVECPIWRVLSFEMSCHVEVCRRFEATNFFLQRRSGGPTICFLSSCRVIGFTPSVWGHCTVRNVGEPPYYMVSHSVITAVSSDLTSVKMIFICHMKPCDRLCGLVVRVLGYRFGGPGSIPGTIRFSEKKKGNK
jgi:hypothetical protein